MRQFPETLFPNLTFQIADKEPTQTSNYDFGPWLTGAMDRHRLIPAWSPHLRKPRSDDTRRYHWLRSIAIKDIVRGRSLWLVMGGVFFGGGVAHAAQTMPEQPIIRTTTRLVTVNVIVRDKNGPVANLTKDDFVLFDRGKPQAVAVFTMDTSQATLAGQTLPSVPNLFTNVVERRANTPSNITVILLDGLNTLLADQQYSLEQLKVFLAHLRPTDRVAIYTLGRTLTLLHDFTADSRQLEQALAPYEGRTDSNAEATVPQHAPKAQDPLQTAMLKQMLDNAANALMPAYYADSARMTATALEVIANNIGPLPGRKNLVWISSSFPFSIGWNRTDSSRFHHERFSVGSTRVEGSGELRTFSKEVGAAARALNNASIAIYPVDARGLTGLDKRYKAESDINALEAKLDRKGLTDPPKGQETMRELAARTGGKAFLNRNDLAAAVREAIDDSAVTYTLGFYPPADAVDGQYHELRVEVPNHAGVSVRSRRGYDADNPKAIPVEAVKQEVERALGSPLEAKGITILARLNREASSIRLLATIAARPLSLHEREGRWKGTIDVVTAQRDAKGHILNPHTQSAAVNVDRKSYEYYLKNGIPYSTLIRPARGAEELRLVVVDQETGALGSVIVPLAEVR